MWSSKRFTQLLGIAHPIVQAPMAGCCTPALAAAVSEAGGLGSLGLGPRTVDFARERIVALKARTNRPFNINFFAYAPPIADPAQVAAARDAVRGDYAALGLGVPGEPAAQGPGGFNEDRLSLLLEFRPAVASFHFGLPPADALARLREAGIRVGATATCVAEAEAVAAAGCDFVVVQGFEAGGHRGSHRATAPDGGIGLMALIPQVADAVTIPLVAAGGIADGRGIAAALALGADAVQMGTAFLRCPEAETDAPRLARLATARDTDTVVTTQVSGAANRVAAGDAVLRRTRAAEAHLPFPLQWSLSGPLVAAGGEDQSAHQFGQAAALSRAVPARELVEDLVADAKERLARLCGRD